MGPPPRQIVVLWTLSLLAGFGPEWVAAQAGVPALGSDYNDVNKDGSYRFGFQTGDAGAHFHAAVANQKNQVAGRFGSWDPAQRRIVDTEYTAGRRGFRARGPNIARKMDLSQVKIPYNPPVSPNSPNYNPTYDGYHDPNEDPSYSFNFRTPTYSKQEKSDSNGRVNGAYYYYDDIGERHDVTYEAGARTGFNVNTPFPDSKVFNGLFYKGPPGKGGTKSRGKSSIQQRLDGSYLFVSSGPDQRRTEISDSSRNVRGSYTYVDDKGQQRTVEYIAGPNIGYRIIKKGIGTNFPPPPPFIPPPNFTNLPDVIGPTPSPGSSGSGIGSRPFNKPMRPSSSGEIDDGYSSNESGGSSSQGQGGGSFGQGNRPSNWPDSGGSLGGGSSAESPNESQENNDYGGGSNESGGIGGQGSGGGKDDDGSKESDYDRPPRPQRPGSIGDTAGSNNGFPPISSTIPGGGGGGSTGGWPTSTTSTTKPPNSFPNLFSPGSTSKYPTSQSPRPTTPPTIITQTPDVFNGYHDNKPKPGSQTLPYPNNCCTNGPSTSRPSSAFPEDDVNGPRRPPRPGQTDDFLDLPFEDLPPKDYNSYRPSSSSSNRPNYFYKPPQAGDSTFLSSNKNYFSFPHGVAVRAHIQSLDILPFGSRIPPPGLAIEHGISSSG